MIDYRVEKKMKSQITEADQNSDAKEEKRHFGILIEVKE